MKKIIGITFILLILLMVIGGCASPVEPPTNQQEPVEDQSSTPQPNEQTSIDADVPQPPALPEE